MSLDAPRKSSRGWIWFFVILVALVVLAVSTLVIYNLRQQLEPAQLAAARKLWEEKRPPDYVLTYTKKGDASGTFIVTVRNGKVASVVMEEEKGNDKVQEPLPQRLYEHYDMNGLFDDIERFLDVRARPDSPRTFMTAVFDPRNGQLLRFVRSVMSTGKRVQIDVEPIRIEPAKAASRAEPDLFRLPQIAGGFEKTAHMLAAPARLVRAKDGVRAGTVAAEMSVPVPFDGELIQQPPTADLPCHHAAAGPRIRIAIGQTVDIARP